MKQMVLLGALVLFFPALLLAQSSSLADLVYASYGHAEHLDAFNEFLGTNGSVSDGLTWDHLTAGEVATFSLVTSIGNFWGVGDYYNASIWADWNGDHIFDNAEQIFAINEEYIEAGLTTFTFQVALPADAYVAGPTWLRARLDWYGDGALTTDGTYYSGEVEDYQVQLEGPPGPPGAVPEPATMVLMGVGLAGGAIAARKKKIKS
jgi:hypothetical protein